jgi:hypothetical protein
MQYLIEASPLDVSTKTLSSGSPYTLVITKTDKSYKVKMKEWEEDVKLREGI